MSYLKTTDHSVMRQLDQRKKPISRLDFAWGGLQPLGCPVPPPCIHRSRTQSKKPQNLGVGSFPITNQANRADHVLKDKRAVKHTGSCKVGTAALPPPLTQGCGPCFSFNRKAVLFQPLADENLNIYFRMGLFSLSGPFA